MHRAWRRRKKPGNETSQFSRVGIKGLANLLYWLRACDLDLYGFYRRIHSQSSLLDQIFKGNFEGRNFKYSLQFN